MPTVRTTRVSDGLLVVDKPQGVTSFDAVAAVRAALHTKKVGHAGTLDPMATGMLVIGFGRATRLLQYIVEHDKTYEATIRLGARTTTDDAEGTIVDAPGVADVPGSDAIAASAGADAVAGSMSAVPDDGFADGSGDGSARAWRARIETVIARDFLGDIEQIPNTFSAIKINGKRAYDLARNGEDVALKARRVHIGEFVVLDVRLGYASVTSAMSPLAEAAVSSTGAASDVPSRGGMIPVVDVDVRVSCSSGTYIRALARDLGETLGIGGYLTRLRRTRVGRFALADDHSGLAAVTVLPAVTADADGDDTVSGTVAMQAIGAHAEPKTFTNRDGETVTRNRCVLDTPAGLTGEARGDWLRARAVGMADAARGAMPVVAVSVDEARELRFGRRIDRELEKGVHYAAIVPACDVGDAGDSVDSVDSVDVGLAVGGGAASDAAREDVAAIIERANRTQAKPVVVFPAV